METDKTPQEQYSTSKDNEAHAPETDNKSFVDQITTTASNKNTPVSSEDDFDEQNREGAAVKSSDGTVVESEIEDMQGPSSSNLEQENNNASAPYANKDVEMGTHADDLIDPKTESNVSKNTLTKIEPFEDNYKSNNTFPRDTPSNLIVNLNEAGQEQGNEIQPNKNERREFESTYCVVRNKISTDNERDNDNDNNINKDTKNGAKDELDELPRPFTQSQEDCSSGKERDHESSYDRQTCLTEIQQNQFIESQTQIKTIDETIHMDIQESEVKTEPGKTTDNENYQDNFNCSESLKREHNKQNMVPECNRTGGTEIADLIATDEKVKKETLCQRNAKPRGKAEVPHDDSCTPKLAVEDAHLSDKQVNSGIPDSEDEVPSFDNKFESLEDDMEIIQLDELEKDKTLSSNLQEETEINLKEELEKENLSNKQGEANQKTIEKMKAALQQREEQLVSAKRNMVKLDGSIYKKEKKHIDQHLRLQEENNMNLAQVESLLDKDRNNQLQIKSLQGEVTQLKIDKQSYATEVKQLTSQIIKKDRILDERKRKIDDFNQKRKEYESKLESTKRQYECMAKEQRQYWEAVTESLNEQIRLKVESHNDLLHRYSRLAGELLTMGNANVTDLSDQNRPTKLAEQFSELYDNEWTDAFEELQSMCDREKINHLLIILQRAYELSSDITASEWLSRCYYSTFKDHKQFGISVCDKDFEDSTNIDAKKEDIDRNEQTPTNVVQEYSQDSSGDTSNVTDSTNIDTEREDIDRSKQTPTDDMQEHSQDSSGDTSDAIDSTQNYSKRENVDQTEQSMAKDAHEDSGDSGGDITDFTETEKQGIEDDDSFVQIVEDSFISTIHQQVVQNNGDNVPESEKQRAPTTEQPTADNNDNHNEEDRASATDFQGESSVDPPSETNKESIQIPADGTSVDPVADMPLVEKETMRVGKLNLLVVEVPYGELKSEQEQVAMKMLPHLKKKVLSCASEKLQKVITDCLMKEFSVSAQATNLVKFVEKCGELCLKMGLKDPPLHIDFIKEGISDLTLFNAEKYKAYTKKGKYLHYVVWPCLFLEKDGPLLCKGTAQPRPD